MAIIGTQLNRENPEFTIDDFAFWMPNFAKFMETLEGKNYFNKTHKIVNQKIFKSIYGSDWELAMSYGIAHYITLIARQNTSPSGSSLNEIAGGGAIKGVLTSVGIGGFSKSYDFNKTMVNEKESLFWNQTSYGANLIALLKTKSVPTIFVVTNNPIT